MKIGDFNKKGDDYTSKASDIIRQLILGGIAVIWLFKSTVNNTTSLESYLIWPLIGLCLALLFDLLQYVSGGFIWKRFYRKEENKAKKQIENNKSISDIEIVGAPRRLNLPIYFFYWAKIIVSIVSYILLIIFLINKIEFL